MTSTTIDGFEVELETMTDRNDPERGEWLDCTVTRGRFHASLACLEGEGALFDGDRDMPVKETTVDRIRAWAEGHGY